MENDSKGIERAGKEIDQLKSASGWLYAGMPRYRALFGRDSIISALQVLDYDEKIAICTADALSELQGKEFNGDILEEPGRIIHEYQDDIQLLNSRKRDVPWLSYGKNYFSIDSTPLFIMLLNEMREKKINIMENLKESMVKSVKWIIEYGINGRYLSYNKMVPGKGPQSMSWRDGIGEVLDRVVSPVSIIGVQSYAYEALKVFKNISGKIGELRDSASERMKELKDNLYFDFTMDNEDYPGIAIGGDGSLNNCVTSEPGHLILSGILSRDKERIIIDRLFEDDMMTPYGIRTMSTGDPYFDSRAYQRGSIWPNDNWLIAWGLRRRGYLKEYNEIKNRMLECALKLNGLPEYVGVDISGSIIKPDKMRIKPCYPQAWSSGAEIYFRTH